MNPIRYIDNFEKSLILKEDEATYIARCSEKLIQDSRRYRLIDLFSGAGGMSLGFSERFGQPFRSVWANDFNKFCVDTYNKNFGHQGASRSSFWTQSDGYTLCHMIQFSLDMEFHGQERT